MQLANVWQYMMIPSTGPMSSLVSQAFEELSWDKNNQYYLARALLGTGEFYFYEGKNAQASQSFLNAKDIFERLGSAASSCAEAFFLLSRTEAASSSFSLAHDYAQKALALAEQSGDGQLIALALGNVGRSPIVMGLFNDAEPIQKRQLLQTQSMGQHLASPRRWSCWGSFMCLERRCRRRTSCMLNHTHSTAMRGQYGSD